MKRTLLALAVALLLPVVARCDALNTVAIDPGATIVITPDALDFGEVPVATPEPAGWILMLMGLTAFTLWRRGFARAWTVRPIAAATITRRVTGRQKSCVDRLLRRGRPAWLSAPP